MALQKGYINSSPIIEDSAATGVSVRNLFGRINNRVDLRNDGISDLVADSAAVIASRRPTHIAETIADLLSVSGDDLVDGQTYLTLGYNTPGDDGGNIYQYDAAGTGVVNSGFVFNMPVGRMVAVNQVVANVRQFGAILDGITNDRGAIQRALDTGKDVFIDNGVAGIRSPINMTIENQKMLGANAVIRALEGVDYNLYINAQYVTVENIEVDGNFSGIGVTANRADGIYINGDNVTLKDCKVYDTASGTSAVGILATPSADNFRAFNCNARDTVRPCYRIDSPHGELHSCNASFLRETQTNLYRFLTSNGGPDSLVINGGTWFSDITGQTNVVIDYNGADPNSQRKVSFNNLQIDHANWTQVEPASQIFKLEDVAQSTFTNVNSNCPCDNFIRITEPTFENESMSLTNCNFNGNFNGLSTRNTIQDCEISGYEDPVFQQSTRWDLISLKNCIFKNFGAWSNVLNTAQDWRFIAKEVEYIHDSASDILLFSTMGIQGINSVTLENFKIEELNTGRVYLSNTTTSRLLATGKEGEVHYDHMMLDYYKVPVNGHTGQSAAGRTDVRATAATTSTQQMEANFSPGVDAFPTISGNSGEIIRNMNPSNVVGPGWIHNGTAWEPIELCGNGSPENFVTSRPGRLYRDLQGGASTTLYVKEANNGNFGWIAK